MNELSYHRKYYIKNKSKILEKQKTKRLDPSFKIKMTTYYKNYYLKNKEKEFIKTNQLLDDNDSNINKCLNLKQKLNKKPVIQAKFIRKTVIVNFD